MEAGWFETTTISFHNLETPYRILQKLCTNGAMVAMMGCPEQ